jgi:ribosomal protein L13E
MNSMGEISERTPFPSPKKRGGRGFSINNSRKYGNLRINAKKVPDFNRS